MTETVCFLILVVAASSCQMGCQKCINNQCTSCMKGFFMQKQIKGICQQCSSNCKACENTHQQCNQCHEGYYLDQYYKQCKTCTAGCKTCSSSSCTTCSSGYYLRPSNNSPIECIKCSYPCLNCQDQYGCLVCSNGYYLQNQSCKQIAVNHIEGRLLQSFSSSCTALNYYRVSNICSRCPNSCLYCEDSIGCMTCLAPYYNSNGNCMKCFNHCLICQAPTICLKCYRGYYVSNVNGSSICLQCAGPTDTNCYRQAETSQYSGIIIGIVVVVAVLSILLGIILYRKCKKTTEEGEKENKVDSSKNILNYQTPFAPVAPVVLKDSLTNEPTPTEAVIWKESIKREFNANTICPICQGKGVNSTTQCRHHFHALCLKEWASRRPVCPTPMCRSGKISSPRVYCSQCYVKYFEPKIIQVFDLPTRCDSCTEETK